MNSKSPTRLFGILNINKPAGMTSRDVVNRVARIVKPAKAGHAGTLDPMATGVLLVGVGPATRLVSFLQKQTKEYRAQFLFGQRSDTDDITGNVTIAENCEPVLREQIETLLPEWTGEIDQVPPAFSAIHVNGKRAYQLARKGEQVTLPSRKVRIDSLEILNYCWPQIEVEMRCGSGTYVRSVGRDLGERLGCGATMSALERTAIGDFTVENSVELDALNSETLAGNLQPAQKAVIDLPRYQMTAEERAKIITGCSIPIPATLTELSSDSEWVAIIDTTGELAALCIPDFIEKTLRPKHVFLVRD